MLRDAKECKDLDYPINLVYAMGASIQDIPKNVEENLNEIFLGTQLLTSKEVDILKFYYRENRTFKEIAGAYNLSVERVRQISHQALRKLTKVSNQILGLEPLVNKRKLMQIEIEDLEKQKNDLINQIIKLQSDFDNVYRSIAIIRAEVEHIQNYCEEPDIKKINMQRHLIEEMNLSIRPYNVLKRAGYKTVEDLKGVRVRDLMVLRNMGKASLNEILNKLEQNYGITLPE